MKQLLLFAIIGTGIVGMTMGFASNTIALNVQQLGVGEEFIESPIDAADVDFELAKVERDGGDGTNSADDFFVNLITGCSFHSDELIPGPATIICKLTDNRNDETLPDGTVVQHFGAVIAEGKTFLPLGYFPSTRIVIPITQTAFDDANDVQNIHDVKIIVQGRDPTAACNNDAIIDADGIASPLVGSTVEVTCGDPLIAFPDFGGSGLDWFDQDGNGVWTVGVDDLHVEGAACPTGIRDGDHDLGPDCKVVDLDGSLLDQEPVDCDIEVGFNFGTTVAVCPDPLIRFHDFSGDGFYQPSEDIVLDSNADGIFN